MVKLPSRSAKAVGELPPCSLPDLSSLCLQGLLPTPYSIKSLPDLTAFQDGPHSLWTFTCMCLHACIYAHMHAYICMSSHTHTHLIAPWKLHFLHHATSDLFSLTLITTAIFLCYPIRLPHETVGAWGLLSASLSTPHIIQYLTTRRWALN